MAEDNNTLLVYSYDRITGVYLGQETAFADPLTPNSYLIPANATDVEPPAYEDGKLRIFDPVEGVWTVIDAPQPDEPPTDLETEEKMAASARYNRNQMLAQSDWRTLPDVPSKHKGTAWETYRQALRDVPQQEGFPNIIDWPTRP